MRARARPIMRRERYPLHWRASAIDGQCFEFGTDECAQSGGALVCYHALALASGEVKSKVAGEIAMQAEAQGIAPHVTTADFTGHDAVAYETRDGSRNGKLQLS